MRTSVFCSTIFQGMRVHFEHGECFGKTQANSFLFFSFLGGSICEISCWRVQQHIFYSLEPARRLPPAQDHWHPFLPLKGGGRNSHIQVKGYRQVFFPFVCPYYQCRSVLIWWLWKQTAGRGNGSPWLLVFK